MMLQACYAARDVVFLFFLLVLVTSVLAIVLFGETVNADQEGTWMFLRTS